MNERGPGERPEEPDAMDVAGVDPDEWAWLPEVDYLGVGGGARVMAQRLHTTLEDIGRTSSGVRVAASTGADGRGVVQLRLDIAAAGRLISMLDRLRPRGPGGPGGERSAA